jgi:hypothetical protein
MRPGVPSTSVRSDGCRLMALADAYDALLLDLDGVLYRGDETMAELARRSASSGPWPSPRS